MRGLAYGGVRPLLAGERTRDVGTEPDRCQEADQDAEFMPMWLPERSGCSLLRFLRQTAWRRDREERAMASQALPPMLEAVRRDGSLLRDLR